MHCLIVSDPKIVMFFFKCILLGIAFISPFCCLTGDCANISERTALYATLLNSSTYNPYVRPVENSSLPVSVQFRFAPVIHYLIWDDHRLVWNPHDYGGLRSLDLPVNKIWQPELVLYERIPSDTDGNIQIETEVAKVLSNGTVYWYTMASTRSFCFIDIRKFPFDKQNCDVTFTTWMHPENEQLLYHYNDLFINDTYKQNEASAGEWDMTLFHYDPNYRCLYCVEDQSYITYKVTLERYKPGLAMLCFVAPCIVVEAMTFLVFCFHVGDAEVATYGLTCVLALVVFLPMLYNLLPDTGVCYVGIYTAILMLFQAIVTIVRIIWWRLIPVSGKVSRSTISTQTETSYGISNVDSTNQTDKKTSSSEGDKGRKTEEKPDSHQESTPPSHSSGTGEVSSGSGIAESSFSHPSVPNPSERSLLIDSSNEEDKNKKGSLCYLLYTYGFGLIYFVVIFILNLWFFIVLLS
ncbi:neuronal acetylcholine receptor subunit alpha-6-like isoform X2 [Apostichopus japonicus]|uniref:neuronal acetylcholine receptor subunit alpha-6-like isoform X2 n=1 Tax=Stichopus japonicus TaxID=307972 RepID=UPI003AB818A0